jgi:F-type H+-transporting ATPase subunit delta
MKLSKDARKLSRGMFQASFTGDRLDEAKVRDITAKVAAEKPRHYIDILKAYQRLLRLEVEQHHAVIESASELDQSTREQLEQTLRAKYGADLTTDFRSTPDLIGGLRIKVGSDVFDSSVRDRLARLESELIRA